MKIMSRKIVFIQPALPNYRVDFFERLYRIYGAEFKVYYALSDLNIKEVGRYDWAVCSGPIKNLHFGMFTQPGIELNISSGDVLVISGNIRNLSSLRLFISSKLSGASILWWGHYASAGGGRLGLFLRTCFMLLSNAVVFYVDSEIDRFRSSLNYCRHIPISCSLNNGIDISNIKELRLKYDSRERDIDFIFIGRITKKASVDLIIEAINQVNNKVMLHVVGDGPLKPYMIEKAKDFGLLDQITWHGTVDDERSISKLMNRSKVFVYAGGVGLSLIHAMAYGLPAILHSSSANHMPEYEDYEDRVTGFSFEYNNVRSLGEVMTFALSDPIKLNQMSENAMRKIGPDFTTEGMAQRFTTLIDNL